jgi:hypothetical protein
VKRRLDDVPLLPPRISFVGQQTVSKDPAVELEGLTLDETVVVGYQNGLDKVRIVEEIDVTGKSAVVKDVTISTSPPRIQSERVLAPQREVPDYPAIPRTGRTNQTHHKLVANTSSYRL